ncbi:MAG TPA: polyprenyl synthetase family protein [Actinophytocola sp.]|uniref:polyprenyl synthetase family protein n=1 Tax=Actinophytocola sp. TaxID=1872138 RepID=UPI002DDC9C93|nr:polyprenyl synthetase family protein [Actinophytocola sp.]HEV2777897.1 polyprenyl synthetase family protein [Actinophytocola sp.]
MRTATDDAAVQADLRYGLSEVESRLAEELTDVDDGFLTEGATYLIRAGGKRFRPRLTLLSGQFGDHPHRKEVISAAVVVELVHVATLYHDDVMDQATQRHGVPSANAAWGNSVAVLLGDLLLARAARIGAELGDEALRLQIHTLDRLIRGQLRETVGAQPDEDPMAHCLSVMADKSASLISMSAQLGALVAGAEPRVCAALARFGERLGMAFQISDDLIDIRSGAAEMGKTPGADLRQGIVTVPMLHALAAQGPEADRLRTILRRGPLTDPEPHAEALDLLRRSPGLAMARADVRAYAARARAQLVALPLIPAWAALESMCDFVVDRTS